MIQTYSPTTSASGFFNNIPMGNPLGYQTSSKWESFKSEKLLQNLCDNVIKLNLRVEQLEQSFPIRSSGYAIPINDLGNPKYLLKSPIYVFLTKEKGNFLVEAMDFDIYGISDNEKDAVDNFKEVLVLYFENLKSSGKNLSKKLEAKLDLLKKLIRNEK